MSDGFKVLGYVFMGVVVFAAFFGKTPSEFHHLSHDSCPPFFKTVALMCSHYHAKRKKKEENMRAGRHTSGHSLANQMTFNTTVISDGSCAVRTANAPIWTTSMVETMDNHSNNTLPRLEVRYPRREIRRQSDADILFGRATIFGFVNEGIQIEENDSVHSGSDNEHRNRNKGKW